MRLLSLVAVAECFALSVAIAGGTTTTAESDTGSDDGSTDSCRICLYDSCLGAVYGSSIPVASAVAKADCSSFFEVTISPAASTVTISVPTIATYETTTFTEVSTSYFTQYVTSTVTVTPSTTAATTNTPVAKRFVGGEYGSLEFDRDATYNYLEKRQTTVIPSQIPEYASSCSGTDDYSSACSCIGVQTSTTTLSQAVTTITATQIESTLASLYITIMTTATTALTAVTTVTEYLS